MPKWISGFERQPVKYQMYFVKYNGQKELLRLDEFWRKLETAETFYWLDESEENAAAINGIHTKEEFSKADRVLISDEIIVPYNPRIKRSEMFKIFRTSYMSQIASLRKLISGLETDVNKQKENGTYKPVSKKDPLLERIRRINDSPFFDIKTK